MPFVTVAIAVGSNEAKKLTDGKSLAVQPVIGGFILGICLFALYEINEPIGRNFCILIIITALLVNGVAVFNVLTKLGTQNGTK